MEVLDPEGRMEVEMEKVDNVKTQEVVPDEPQSVLRSQPPPGVWRLAGRRQL